MHDSPACDHEDTASLDPGPRQLRPGTTRMCAVSREVRPLDQLIRFVVTPEGDVVADLKRRLPGRGMWITASRAMVEEALRRRHFSRAFKRQLQVTPTLAADTEKQMERMTREALAIAAKAGEVKAGFAKVEAALRAGSAMALLHARDAAGDGTRKLDALVRLSEEIRGGKPPIQIVSPLESAELDLALSRSNVIHAALLGGPASRTFLSRCQMLVRYRSGGSRDVGIPTAQDFQDDATDRPMTPLSPGADANKSRIRTT
ncbi:MAG: RNA-binding protein [Alphaproteobacteria bacterium]|nr:RNA-binding protein [Alphaproteobacteria bacterium]